jgi:hypothetical protein
VKIKEINMSIVHQATVEANMVGAVGICWPVAPANERRRQVRNQEMARQIMNARLSIDK